MLSPLVPFLPVTAETIRTPNPRIWYTTSWRFCSTQQPHRTRDYLSATLKLHLPQICRFQ